MVLNTVIAGLAAAAVLGAAALTPSDSAHAAGSHGGVGGVGGGHPGGGGVGGIHSGGSFGGFHPGGGVGGFHPGGGAFRGFRGGYGYWGGAYPLYGYDEWPYDYYYGETCGYVHVKYYRNNRPYWHWVYECE